MPQATLNALESFRADLAEGVNIEHERRIKLLSKLSVLLTKLTHLDYVLDRDSIADEEFVGICHSETRQVPELVPQFEQTALIFSNLLDVDEPVNVRAYVFYYLAENRITFPDKDYTSFVFCESGWRFDGWVTDHLGEFTHW